MVSVLRMDYGDHDALDLQPSQAHSTPGRKTWGGEDRPSKPQLLFAGFDSLEIYAELLLSPAMNQSLQELKDERYRLALYHRRLGQIGGNNNPIVVYRERSSYHAFPFRVSYGGIDLCYSPRINRSPGGEYEYLRAFLLISGELLAKEGLAAAYAEAEHLVARLGGAIIRHHVARVDLYADLHLPAGLTEPYVRKHTYQLRPNECFGKVVDGLLVGYTTYDPHKPPDRKKRSRMMCLYEKTRQMARTGAGTWATQRWAYVPDSHVYRVEYRPYRRWLAGRGVHTVEDLEDHAALLWDTATGPYFSLRMKTRTRPDAFESRWKVVRSARSYFEVPGGSTRFREPVRRPPDHSQMYATILGYIASIAAREGIEDFDQAMQFVMDGLRTLNNTGERWTKAFERNAERVVSKGRQ